MRIVPITLENLPLFQSIRLRSLEQDPYAFGSTYAREVAMSEEEWQRRLVRWSGNGGLGLLAMEGDTAQGIVGVLVVEDSAHTAEVVSMWVAPEVRRTGLGAKLLDAIDSWSRDHGVHTLRLGVTKDNAAALTFYKRVGFALLETSASAPVSCGGELTMTKRLGSG